MRARRIQSAVVCVSVAISTALLAVFLALAGRVVAVLDPWNQHRLFWISQADTRLSLRTPAPIATFEALRGMAQFDAVEALMSADELPVALGGARRDLQVARATPGLLSLLTGGGSGDSQGTRTATSDPRAITVLIRPELARATFGSEGAALGKGLTLPEGEGLIVGLLPMQTDSLPMPSGPIDILAPLGDPPAGNGVHIVAKLRVGTSSQSAQAEVDRVWARLGQGTSDKRALLLSPTASSSSPILKVMSAAGAGAIALLLISVSNLAHLLRSQSLASRTEAAVRWALGASDRSLLTWTLRSDGGAIVCGCLAAAPIAVGIMRLVQSALPSQVAFLSEAPVSGWPFAAACGVAFALAAALEWSFLDRSASRADTFRGGPSRPAGRFWTAAGDLHLVTVAAGATALGVVASLLACSFWNRTRLDFGLQADGLHEIVLALPESKYSSPDTRVAPVKEFLQHLQRLPGVECVAAASSVPPDTGVFMGSLTFGRLSEAPSAVSTIALTRVGRGYFGCIRQALVVGREFSEDELVQAASVVVLSRGAAKLLAQSPEAAIGRHVRFGDRWREVIGIVGDMTPPGILYSLGGLHAYTPLSQPSNPLSVVIRWPNGLVRGVEAAAFSVEPDSRATVSEMKTKLSRGSVAVRSLAILLSGLALASSALALFAVYSAFAEFTVRQRFGIAIRMALGATSQGVIRWLLQRCVLRVGAGVVVGIALSFPLSRLLAEHLFRVAWTDVATRVGVALFVGGAGILAALVPAITASRMLPSEVLRAK